MTTTTVPKWTVPALQDVLIGILATYLGTTAEELTADLRARGSGMPVDSLDLFDVLPEFWSATGLKVPTKELRRKTMSSIEAFTTYVATWGKE